MKTEKKKSQLSACETENRGNGPLLVEPWASNRDSALDDEPSDERHCGEGKVQ